MVLKQRVVSLIIHDDLLSEGIMQSKGNDEIVKMWYNNHSKQLTLWLLYGLSALREFRPMRTAAGNADG